MSKMTESQKHPSDELDRFQLRLPHGLRDIVAERARKNQRSMNSEFVALLQAALFFSAASGADAEAKAQQTIDLAEVPLEMLMDIMTRFSKEILEVKKNYSTISEKLDFDVEFFERNPNKKENL